jgi:hypothetical protein
MVAYKISLTEGKQGTIPESTVLSRVRMLESHDARTTDTLSLPTRKNVPTFPRRTDEGSQKQDFAKASPYSSINSDVTEKATASHGRVDPQSQPLESEKLSKTEARLPSSTKRSLGDSSGREEHSRGQSSSGSLQFHKHVMATEHHRSNPSPKADPSGFRGALHNRRALSESPLRPTRKAESPSRGPSTKDTMSSNLTKKFDNWEKSSDTRRPPKATEPPSTSGHGNDSSSKISRGQERAHEPLAAFHPKGFRKTVADGLAEKNVDADKTVVGPVTVMPQSRLHNPSTVVAEDDRALAKPVLRTSMRKAEDLSAMVSITDQGQRSSPLMRKEHEISKKESALAKVTVVRPRAPSPLPNLQRHHWDKRKETAVKQDKLESVSAEKKPSEDSRRASTSGAPLSAQRADAVELNWPSVSLKAGNFSKHSSSVSSSSQDQNATYKRENQSTRTKMTGNAVNGVAPPKVSNQKLLRDASAVMQEEKLSNGGTSTSSSGRSTLSQKELSGIASKALKLYQARADTQATRNKNSMLHQMLSEKKTAKPPVKNERKTEVQTATDAFAYSSAARLSERLTRAERFTALKESRIKARWQSEDGSTFSADPSLSPVKKSTHPVFGYTNRALTINMQDDASTVPSEPSCIRRSKHLSKVMQQKADHFASASPTRRMKNTSGYRNHQETRGSLPQKAYAPYLQDRGYSGQAQAKYGSPKKRANQYRQKMSGLPRSPLPPLDNTNVLRPIYHAPYSYPYAPAALPGDEHVGMDTDSGLYGQQFHRERPLSQKAHQFLANEKRHQHHHGSRSEGKSGTFPLQDDQENYRSEDPFTNGPEEFAHDLNRFRPLDVRGMSNTNNKQVNELRHLEFHDGSLYQHKRAPPYHKNVDLTLKDMPPNRNVGFGESHQQNMAYGSKQEVDSQLMSEFSEDGPDTIGDDSAQDNTFTGSLNKHDIEHESSDSYATRPDAFQWLHQKYGTQPPKVRGEKAQKQLADVVRRTNVKADANVRSIENIDDDEEDDIFFGLEEAHTDDDIGKERKPAKSPQTQPSRMPSTSLQVILPQKVDKLESRRLVEGKEMTSSQPDAPLRQDPPKQPVPKTKLSEKASSSKGNAKMSTSEVVSSPTPRTLDEPSEHPVRTVRAAGSEKTVASEMTSSILAEKGWKARYRPNPVDTILEEPHLQASLEDDEATAEEESLPDETKPAASMLKSLSSAFVKSIQQACKMPGKSHISLKQQIPFCQCKC